MNRLYKKPKKIFNVFVNYIEENIKEYFIISIVFLIGVVLGIIFINKLSEDQLNSLKTYLTSFVTDFKNSNNIDFLLLLKESISKNIVLLSLLWFMGSTVIGILFVYLIIGFKGFCLGYASSTIIYSFGAIKGSLFLTTSMLMQNILFIPCLISLGVSCRKLYKSIIGDRRKENIKLELIRHTLFSVFILIFLILSSFIEVYMSTKLLNMVIKYI